VPRGLADVAHEHSIPLAVYWIQPAAVFLAYYHYFHGHDQIIAEHVAEPAYEVSLPGLPSPIRIRDMPSFITETPQSELSRVIVEGFRQLFSQIDQEKLVVLVNTFAALEDAALRALEPYADIISVGPAVPPALNWCATTAMARSDKRCSHPSREASSRRGGKLYLEWLDARPEKSVVYLSFGSLLTNTVRQAEETLHGLQDCGRRYLWVVRREGRAEDVDLCLEKVKKTKQGMVVRSAARLVPSVSGVFRYALWMELDARSRGARRTHGRRPGLVRPTVERASGRGVERGC
jgi:hypothetical protein